MRMFKTLDTKGLGTKARTVSDFYQFFMVFNKWMPMSKVSFDKDKERLIAFKRKQIITLD